MTVALFLDSGFRTADQWLELLGAELPDEDLRLIGDIHDHSDVEIAIVRGDQPGDLGSCPNLAFVQCLWAGVEKLLAHPDVPAHVPLARMVDPAMGDQMANTALAHVLDIHQHHDQYRERQAQKIFAELTFETPAERTVGILGLGALGGRVGEVLRMIGFNVIGLRPSASGTTIDASGVLVTNDLGHLQRESDIIVNLLPLTETTRGILDTKFFTRMKSQSALINLARGPHVVVPDLLNALDQGQLRRAILDVFDVEPLPEDSPLWTHPGVTITPHVAANTDPRTASKILAANVKAWRAGTPLTGMVDRSKAY